MEIIIDFPVVYAGCKTIISESYIDYRCVTSPTAKSWSISNINALQVVRDKKVFN